MTREEIEHAYEAAVEWADAEYNADVEDAERRRMQAIEEAEAEREAAHALLDQEGYEEDLREEEEYDARQGEESP